MRNKGYSTLILVSDLRRRHKINGQLLGHNDDAAAGTSVYYLYSFDVDCYKRFAIFVH